MKVTIYHNPRCSKSRETLTLLENNGIDPVVVRYLESPPDAATIRHLASLLGVSVRGLLRTGDSAYTELGLDNEALSDDQLVDAILAHPELIQRPIVVANGKARFGRPPEQVLEIISS